MLLWLILSLLWGYLSTWWQELKLNHQPLKWEQAQGTTEPQRTAWRLGHINFPKYFWLILWNLFGKCHQSQSRQGLLVFYVSWCIFWCNTMQPNNNFISLQHKGVRNISARSISFLKFDLSLIQMNGGDSLGLYCSQSPKRTIFVATYLPSWARWCSLFYIFGKNPLVKNHFLTRTKKSIFYIQTLKKSSPSSFWKNELLSCNIVKISFRFSFSFFFFTSR